MSKTFPVKLFAVFLAGVVGLVVISGLFVDHIPPHAMTVTRMQHLKRRVLQYAQSHDRLPASLTALPPMEGYDDRIQDGWQRDIAFEVSGDVIAFRSLGRDGVLGGTGEDADIVRSFPLHDAQGRWSNEFVGWTEDIVRKGPNR